MVFYKGLLCIRLKLNKVKITYNREDHAQNQITDIEE